MIITTIYGDMDESTVTPDHSVVDTPVLRTTVTQYLLNGEVVHRSANITIKQGFGAPVAQGKVG